MGGEIDGPEFLGYYRQQVDAMDTSHLELALGILGRIGTDDAHFEVARQLNHSDFSVRFVATKVIANMATIDQDVMGLVAECLVAHAGDAMDLAHELRTALDRPANAEARRIATECRMKLGLAKA